MIMEIEDFKADALVALTLLQATVKAHPKIDLAELTSLWETAQKEPAVLRFLRAAVAPGK
jgi:hypothetical protein